MRYLQPPRFNAAGGQALDHRLNRTAIAGNHDVVRAVDRRNRDGISIRLNCFGNSCFVYKYGRHLSASGQLAHQAAPRRNQLQAIFQTEHPGKTGRHIFTDAVAHHGGRFNAPGTPQLRQRIFNREQRRLGIGGVIQRRFFTRFRVQHLQQRLIKQRVQNLRALIQRGPESRLRFVQLPPHIHILRALPGKQEGYTRFIQALNAAADGSCNSLPFCKGGQSGVQVFG